MNSFLACQFTVTMIDSAVISSRKSAVYGKKEAENSVNEVECGKK